MMNNTNKETKEYVRSEDKEVRHSRSKLDKDALRVGSVLVGIIGLIIKVVNDKRL